MFSLKELFDKNVVVSLDKSWSCRWPGGKEPEDKLWCYEIVGKRGLLYPQSENSVCVCADLRTGRRLLKLFGSKARFKRKSDIEFELIIPLELVKSTFRYIKPRMRRSKPLISRGSTPLISGVSGEKTGLNV
jgi:hypothetical protein